MFVPASTVQLQPGLIVRQASHSAVVSSQSPPLPPCLNIKDSQGRLLSYQQGVSVPTRGHHQVHRVLPHTGQPGEVGLDVPPRDGVPPSDCVVPAH